MPDKQTSVVQPTPEEFAAWRQSHPPIMGADDGTVPAEAPAGEGQGDEVNGGGLYDLASAPDDLRPFLEAELKKIEGNVSKRFQDHSQYRDQWSPYEELGVR